MIDVKITLKNLHSKFPNLTLDNLFDILDCYVETPDYSWRNNKSTTT